MTKKLYYLNPYQTELDTKIIDKGFFQKKPFVILEETIFYPEGGGQPADSGKINGVAVTDVQIHDDLIMHFLDQEIEIGEAKCILNWDRRLDHMQQHTGQHILSGVAYILFKAQTVGFHLGTEDTTIDLSKENFNNQELALLEKEANQFVVDNHRVNCFFPDNEELENLKLRRKPKTDEDIRIVNVEELDFSPCGGTHHQTTAEVGIIKIIATEKIRGNTRLHILCGKRAYQDYKTKTNIITTLIELTNSPQEEIIKAIEATYDDAREKNRELNLLKENLAIAVANNKLQDSAVVQNNNLLTFASQDFDTQQFRAIANYFADSDNIIGFIYSLENGSFILFKNKDLDLDLKKVFAQLKNIFNCQGGGNGNVIQGKCDLNKLSEVEEKFAEIIKQNC